MVVVVVVVVVMTCSAASASHIIHHPLRVCVVLRSADIVRR
jgi:hypothetical protein